MQKISSLSSIVEKLTDALDDDLLSPKYRLIKKQFTDSPKTFGHCYILSEAIYHILGGKKSYLTPQVIPGEVTHWYLVMKSAGIIFDPSHEHINLFNLNYSDGRGCGFLTKQPSKRAKILIKRAKLGSYLKHYIKY